MRKGGVSPGNFRRSAALAFAGRDTAAGKSWEAWVRKYWEKKAAGEKGIALEPEVGASISLAYYA